MYLAICISSLLLSRVEYLSRAVPGPLKQSMPDVLVVERRLPTESCKAIEAIGQPQFSSFFVWYCAKTKYDDRFLLVRMRHHEGAL